jgi:2,3-bisphosphoglycerate-independent phosphoglycerate mutase
MTEYSKILPTHVAFPPIEIKYPLARVIGEAHMRQLHIAETEKYAHVTYFFNGGEETHFQDEDWELVPSIASAKYNEMPEMRAKDIADHIISNLSHDQFILANFANADMVGHTGDYQAIKKAIATLDEHVGRVMDAVLEKNGVLLITGDHGNAEMKINTVSGEILTEHTTSAVPLYLIGKDFERKTERTEAEILAQRSDVGGILTDVAPTILELLGLSKPDEMSGKSLLEYLKTQN